MMPNLIYQQLATDTQLDSLGITEARIFESQSIDTIPFTDGYFITILFEEMAFSSVSALARGPRTMTIAVHHSYEIDRDYATLTSILNRIDEVLLAIDDTAGTDGLKVYQIARRGRSGNLIDPGYKTITRTATYGVSYDEFAA